MSALITIAKMKSEFPEKFGIPRQSGVVAGLKSTILFEPEYRNPDALRGLEEFSHLWLIWGFSESRQEGWAPTVRPPRLGGNARVGVFASRSPFRPNGLGLSCVELAGIEQHPLWGPAIHVLGADLMDGTPIYDIKPYLPYADCHPEATGGFASVPPAPRLRVEVSPDLRPCLPEARWRLLVELLAQDPRPAYQREAGRVYGMRFGPNEIKFSVLGELLTVLSVN